MASYIQTKLKTVKLNWEVCFYYSNLYPNIQRHTIKLAVRHRSTGEYSNNIIDLLDYYWTCEEHMNLAILLIECETNIMINIEGYIYCNGSINNMKK